MQGALADGKVDLDDVTILSESQKEAVKGLTKEAGGMLKQGLSKATEKGKDVVQGALADGKMDLDDVTVLSESQREALKGFTKEAGGKLR